MDDDETYLEFMSTLLEVLGLWPWGSTVRSRGPHSGIHHQVQTSLRR